MQNAIISDLQIILNHQINNDDLFLQALTHSSTQNAHQPNENYQRLEFLGDRVLGLVIAEQLYLSFPNDNEGQLAKRLAYIVQKSTLAQIARNLHINDMVITSDNERASGGNQRSAILCDVIEALIAALYLDAGYDAAQQFIMDNFSDYIHELPKHIHDPKTTLQEYAMKKFKNLPVYEIIEQAGPSHAPLFQIRVTLPNGHHAIAKGTSKKKGEAAAASKLLEKINF